jgi:hypothetical protein
MREPYLRPAAPEGTTPAPCPPGGQPEPAGTWHGTAMEVVYDPRRHDWSSCAGRCLRRSKGGFGPAAGSAA